MKKSLHLISIRLLITIILCSLSKGVLAQDSTTETWEEHVQAPSGWKTSPYPSEISISSAAELAWVAKMVNDDTDTGNDSKKGFEGVTINLTTDLNLAEHLWIPIGEKGKDTRYTRPFKGAFEGNNNTISNIKIVSDGSAGLFGQIDHTTIKNIKLINCFIEKRSSTYTPDKNIYAGCIAGASFSSTIENCHAEGAINYKGESAVYVGGITGKNASEDDTQAIIKDCSFDGEFDYNLELTEFGGIKTGWIGGIAGTNNASTQTEGTIINCHAKITAKVIQGAVGGITTSSRGVIKDCITEGDINVTLEGTMGIGGIVSDNGKPLHSNPTYTIENCKSSCNINLAYKVNKALSSDSYYAKVGGIAGSHGRFTPPITHCTTSGTISVELVTDQPLDTDLKDNRCIAGGIVGCSQSSILDCETSAEVSAITNIPATEAYAGGTAGILFNERNISISNCIASGIITTKGATCYGGGIAGLCSRNIKNSFSTANIISYGNNNFIGGIAGDDTYSIKDCYSTGNITSFGETSNVGGIAGRNTSEVLNCFATGKVEAINNAPTKSSSKGYVGGIVGMNEYSVENCLALNLAGIANYTTTTGRIIGNNDGEETTINNKAHPEIPGEWEDKTEINGSDWDYLTIPFDPADAWDFTDNTQLPKLKKINDDGSSYSNMIANQPDIPLISLERFTITFNTPDNGTLTVNQEDGTPISSGTKVLGSTQLTITAEASEGYQVNELLVNSSPFTSGDVLTVSSDITITVTITKKPEPTPDPDPDPTPKPDPDPTPTVYHIVTLPQIEGATTDPVAGEYEVEAWSSFRFYLTLDEAYSQSSPIVTTDRSETITPRSSDGAYIIKYVRQPIAISINGIIKNPDPVANETIDANSPKVWTKDSYLHLQTPQPETVFIYTFNGTLLKKLTNLSGNKTLWLPQGNYIVLIGKERFKVQVK
ncbi:GLUG motif-containing protein [Parabacteroides gordonii]|uniref:GLUG motif-containing protein n=1 Tax=Parabacteroides gordonii TaxID=574930 RepID=UPI003A83EFD3